MEPKRWTEDEILSIDGENAYFERKSGDFLKESKFEEKLAKQLSAFANTEGGLIVIGVNDEGDPDGVDRMHNDRLEKRQWLSQKVGSLLAPQAVHVEYAIPSEHSRIPNGKTLLTIEIQKSILAPHQTVKECIYYYRVGSESMPAPHHYVESLFSRSRFPGPAVAAELAMFLITIFVFLWKEHQT